MAVCFAPKPPPMRGLTTRTSLFLSSSAVARMRRTWNGICVEETTSSRPYASQRVKARNVSIMHCWFAFVS